MVRTRRRTRRTIALLFVGLLVGSTGCVLSQSTQGSGMDSDPLQQIVVGKSTRADVTALLGPPDEVIYSNREHDPLYEQAYRYRRTKTKQTALFLVIFSTHRSDTKYDHVMVFFDDQGRVEHVGARLDATDASYGGPW